MDWWTFFFGVWAGAATVTAWRYRRIARRALDLAEDCNKGWSKTIDGMKTTLALLDELQHQVQNPEPIEGIEIITGARPSSSGNSRKDLVN